MRDGTRLETFDHDDGHLTEEAFMWLNDLSSEEKAELTKLYAGNIDETAAQAHLSDCPECRLVDQTIKRNLSMPESEKCFEPEDEAKSKAMALHALEIARTRNEQPD